MSRYIYKVNDAFLPNSKYILYTPGPAAKKLPFRVAACGHFFATSSYEIEREGISYHLLILTLSGVGEIRYAGKHFSVHKGQAFLIDCEKRHHYKTTGEMWEMMWIRFACSPEVDYLQLLNGDSLEIINLDNPATVTKYIEKLLYLTQSHDPTTDLSLSNLLSMALTELSIQKQIQNTQNLPQSAKKIIFDAVTYFEDHYAEDINIDCLAQNYHLSQYSFIRLFKKQTGLAPYEFLQKIRITEAKILLEQSDYTINEISQRVGFNNQNNFIRMFKLLVATTPLRYRNQIRGPGAPAESDPKDSPPATME